MQSWIVDMLPHFQNKNDLILFLSEAVFAFFTRKQLFSSTRYVLSKLCQSLFANLSSRIRLHLFIRPHTTHIQTDHVLFAMDSKITLTEGTDADAVDAVTIEKVGTTRVLNTRRIVIVLVMVLGLAAAAAVTGWYASEEMLFQRAVHNMDMNDSYNSLCNCTTCKALEPSWPEDDDDDESLDALTGNTNSSHRDLKKKCPYLVAFVWGGSTKKKNTEKCLKYNANRGCSSCCSVSSDGTYYNYNKGRWETTCYCGNAGYYDVTGTCS
jgi:hypothetical protein